MHDDLAPERPRGRQLPTYVLALTCFLLTATATRADLVVDDFTEISGALYPHSRTWPNITTSLDDTPLSTTAGNLRRMFAQPIPNNSTVTDATGTVNIDPFAGQLEWSTTQTAKGGLLISWLSNDPNNPMDLDASAQTEFVVAYANVSRQVLMTIRFSNAIAGDIEPTAGNRIDVVLEPTFGAGEFRFAWDMMEPMGQLPAIDRTSVDAISVDLLSNDFGTAFTLTSVYFVPEPARHFCLAILFALTPFTLRK